MSTLDMWLVGIGMFLSVSYLVLWALYVFGLI